MITNEAVLRFTIENILDGLKTVHYQVTKNVPVPGIILLKA